MLYLPVRSTLMFCLLLHCASISLMRWSALGFSMLVVGKPKKWKKASPSEGGRGVKVACGGVGMVCVVIGRTRNMIHHSDYVCIKIFYYIGPTHQEEYVHNLYDMVHYWCRCHIMPMYLHETSDVLQQTEYNRSSCMWRVASFKIKFPV